MGHFSNLVALVMFRIHIVLAISVSDVGRILTEIFDGMDGSFRVLSTVGDLGDSKLPI